MSEARPRRGRGRKAAGPVRGTPEQKKARARRRLARAVGAHAAHTTQLDGMLATAVDAAKAAGLTDKEIKEVVAR